MISTAVVYFSSYNDARTAEAEAYSYPVTWVHSFVVFLQRHSETFVGRSIVELDRNIHLMLS